MPRTLNRNATPLVAAVAFEVQKTQFRGNVFGQQGMFLDRKALQDSASGFNIDDYRQQSANLDQYIDANGALYI